MLRFWESKFTQLRPLKRGGGRRYYRPEDVALLRRIHGLLYREGYTIKGVQRVLRTSRKTETEEPVELRAATAGEPSSASPIPASPLQVRDDLLRVDMLAELKVLRALLRLTDRGLKAAAPNKPVPMSRRFGSAPIVRPPRTRAPLFTSRR